MDIDDLRIISAIAKSGSMNRAAAKLHMVQSNVTARIRHLEDELGVTLFVRHSRGVTLSESGKRLLAYSGPIDALLQEAIASVKENGIPKGLLRIGSLDQTLSLHLSPALAKYTARYPSVEMKVTTGNTPDLIEGVAQEDLDCAFVLGPVAHPSLTEEPLFCDELVLATGLAISTIDELRHVRDLKALVRAEGCSYRRLLTGILEAQGIKYQVMSVASSTAIRTLVEADTGVALLAKGALAESWKNSTVSIHELPKALSRVQTVVITRVDRPIPSALEAFLRLSRESSNLPA